MNDHEKLERVYEAVFGDGNGDVGIHRKVDDMHPIVMDMKSFLDATTTGGKAIKWFAGMVAAIGGAGYVIYKIAHGQSPF